MKATNFPEIVFEKESAYDRGMIDGAMAAMKGVEMTNPYTQSNENASNWEAGYRDGKDEIGYDN